MPQAPCGQVREAGGGDHGQFGLDGVVVRLAGTPSEPFVDVDLLAVKEFVADWIGGEMNAVRILDVTECREDVIRF